MDSAAKPSSSSSVENVMGEGKEAIPTNDDGPAVSGHESETAQQQEQQHKGHSLRCHWQFLMATVNVLNLSLMLILLPVLVIWSWNGQQIGAAIDLLLLGVHSLLWFNTYLLRKLILYALFLVAYAFVLLLRAVHLLVIFAMLLPLVHYGDHIGDASSSNSPVSELQAEMVDRRGLPMPKAALLVLLLAGLLILVLGIALEICVFALMRRQQQQLMREEDKAETEGDGAKG